MASSASSSRTSSWGRLDYLVIDSPPGTGDEPLAVAQMVGHGAGPWSSPRRRTVAVADVRRSVSFCRTLKLRVVGIVENMSGLACPHCGKPLDLFKTGGGEQLAMETGVPFLGRIPLDPQIVASGDEGRPFVQVFADGSSAKAFAAIMKLILNQDTKSQSTSLAHNIKETQR